MSINNAGTTNPVAAGRRASAVALASTAPLPRPKAGRRGSATLEFHDHSNPGIEGGLLGTPLGASVTAALLASKARAAERISAREQAERIRLRDMSNMLGLIDAVNTGRLQATMAAQRAGNFGGAGLLAQVAFLVFGGFFGAFFVVVVLMATTWGRFGESGSGGGGGGAFLASGLWFSAPCSAAALARAYYLRETRRGKSAYSAVAGDATSSSSTAAAAAAAEAAGGADGQATLGVAGTSAQEALRLNAAAQRALAIFMFGATGFWGWFGVWLGASAAGGAAGGGGNGGFDGFPVLPRAPSVALSYTLSAGLSLASVLLLRVAWLIELAHVKRAQRGLVLWFGAMGVVFCAAAPHAVPDTWPTVFLASIGAGFLLLAAALHGYLVFRQRHAMTPALQHDIDAYVAAWDGDGGGGGGSGGGVLRDPVQAAAVAEIETLLARRPPPQRAHPPPRRTIAMQGRPVPEQLMVMLAQAWGINDRFQLLAAAWKARCRTAGSGGEEKEKGLLPKRRQRAIEKVWRTYAGNATRLSDLVRCSIVFDSVPDLQECLALIIADPRVNVVRVKNRFSAAYDAVKECCGYRDIQLSVTLNDLGEEHERMGLHEHVCEVQLHLNSIYKLKNDEGHKRYVEFRNRRAE
jgi:hypothetical protein